MIEKNVTFIKNTHTYKNHYDVTVEVWKVEVQTCFGYTGVNCDFCAKDFTNTIHVIKQYHHEYYFCDECADSYFP